MTEIKGQCLCGAVGITAKPEKPHVSACHCRMCRRWGGGPFMEVDCGTNVSFEGADHITVYDSSDWAERGFCGKCGSHLFYRLKGTQEHMVPVGLFDDLPEAAFELQVFIDEKPGYYSFAENTKVMSGEEIFALFGAAPD